MPSWCKYIVHNRSLFHAGVGVAQATGNEDFPTVVWMPLMIKQQPHIVSFLRLNLCLPVMGVFEAGDPLQDAHPSYASEMLFTTRWEDAGLQDEDRLVVLPRLVFREKIVCAVSACMTFEEFFADGVDRPPPASRSAGAAAHRREIQVVDEADVPDSDVTSHSTLQSAATSVAHFAERGIV